MTLDKFAARTSEDLARLVREWPLAWVVSLNADQPCATVLPLRPMVVAGRFERLMGHFSRSNPQVQALKQDARALILFLGPHGYISPSWMADRTQAPTWNYASAQFVVDVSFFDSAPEIDAHLRELVSAMEASRLAAWSIEDMGERFLSLSRGIIGFTARIRETLGRFKLGQDERDDVFADIVRGLSRERPSALLEWMQDFNSHRCVPTRE